MSAQRAKSKRRLKLAQAEWRFQDRTRGYTTYRSGRPNLTPSRKDSQCKQIAEAVIAIAALALVVLCAGIAGGVTGQ